jgi:hypothetical protein
LPVIDLNSFLWDRNKCCDKLIQRKMNLTYLRECIDEAHPKAYTNITAGEYPDKRLKEIRLNNN